MSKKAYSIENVREQVAQLLKARVDSYSEELRMLGEMELQKAEPCAKCGEMHSSQLDKCGEMLPTKKDEIKPTKDVTPAKSGHGSLPRRIKKSQPPMAKPPTKAGSATAPTSKVGSPKLGNTKPADDGLTKGAAEIAADPNQPNSARAAALKIPKLPKKTLAGIASGKSPADAVLPHAHHDDVHAPLSSRIAGIKKPNLPTGALKQVALKSENDSNNGDMQKSNMDVCALCGEKEHLGDC